MEKNKAMEANPTASTNYSFIDIINKFFSLLFHPQKSPMCF